MAAATLNEGERSPFCSAVVVGTQWVQIGKTRQIKVHLLFPCKFQKININSVSGHCTHLTFKIRQIVATISLSGQFNDFLKSYFLAGFFAIEPKCEALGSIQGCFIDFSKFSR